MALLQNKSTRALIIIMCALAVIGLSLSYLYYNNENNSVDPRVKDARKLYDNYNRYASLSQYDSVFFLMDTMEQIFNSIEHYDKSYEKVVLYNNRAAAYISMYMQTDSLELAAVRDSLISKAEKAALKSISIIDQWFKTFGEKDELEVQNELSKSFFKGWELDDEDKKKIYLEKRTEEIMEAQLENLRRLSVSYTSLGMVKRYQENYDSAALYYKHAIDLWDRNLTAENNLNILLNKPLKKRNLIQKIFPPER